MTRVINTTLKNTTKILTSKLNKLTKTDKYKATNEIKRIYTSIRLRNSLKSYAIKNKATITYAKSAFNEYVNAYSITNITLKNLKGLSYIKYQYETLRPFLIRSPNMKILISVYIILEQIIEDENGNLERIETFIKEVRSRRYEIYNTKDLQETLNNASADVELQILNAQFKKSNLKITGIDKIVINYDRFNPTKGGSYIELPKHIAFKKACIHIKN